MNFQKWNKKISGLSESEASAEIKKRAREFSAEQSHLRGPSEKKYLSHSLVALPDCITATVYLLTWFSPFLFGLKAVKYLMLLMLVEFIMVHSGGFLGSIFLDEKLTQARKSMSLIGMGFFYLLFIGAFAFIFEAMWPVYSFLWLLIAKLLGIWLSKKQSTHARESQVRLWGVSVMAYLFAVFFTTLLWLPKFGITATRVSEFGIPGKGLWVEQPHTVIAAGFIYFALLAWFKFKQPSWLSK